MLDNVLIPHDAIYAFIDGRRQPKKLDGRHALRTIEEASSLLGMSLKEIEKLVESKQLFAVEHIDLPKDS